MRFSDMMGSGDDPSSTRPAPSESEDVIADALAPYLDATSIAPVRAATSAPVGDPGAQPEVVLDVTSERVAEAVPEVVPARIPTAISDLAPVSDDLLPRKR
jgi:hypothetical protein